MVQRPLPKGRSGIIGSVIGAIVALLLYRKFGKSLKR